MLLRLRCDLVRFPRCAPRPFVDTQCRGQSDSLGIFRRRSTSRNMDPDLVLGWPAFGLCSPAASLENLLDARPRVHAMDRRVNCLCENTTPESDRAVNRDSLCWTTIMRIALRCAELSCPCVRRDLQHNDVRFGQQTAAAGAAGGRRAAAASRRAACSCPGCSCRRTISRSSPPAATGGRAALLR